MKRLWVLLILVVLLCSCGKETPPADLTEGSDTGQIVSTTETSSVTDSTEPEIPPETTGEAVVIGAYRTTEDILRAYPFESFMPFPGNRGYYWEKIQMADYGYERSKAWSPVRIRVVGMSDVFDSSYSIYYIQVVDVYGAKDVDTERIYTMYYYGTPSHPLYGRPPLEIGGEYLRLSTRDDFAEYPERTWEASLMMPITERDGTEYVYGYGIGFDGLKCAVAITDNAENQIYKQGTHDAEIAAVLADGHALPTFDYKCELLILLEALCR